MNTLLKEYLSYIEEEGQPLPNDLDQLYHKGYGKYYYDSGFTQYAGRVKGTQWYPASTGGTPAQSAPPQPSQPAQSQQPAPQVQTEPVAAVSQTPVDPNPSIEAAKIAGVEPARPNDIVEGIFSKPTTITIGTEEPSVRNIINPSTGEVVDVSTPEGRSLAIEILNSRLEQFRANGKIKQVCDALADTSTPTGERTALRKWLGTLGELGGLRDMLEAGHQAYLYADSTPKNDIVALIDCGDGPNSSRDIRVAAISTKTTSGKQVGRIDASALVYVMDSVSGKMFPVPGRGKDFNFKAENVAQALFGMQKRIYSALTRGDVKRGERFGGSERRIEVSPDRRRYYDPDLLAQAERESKTAKSARDSGGQRTLVAARKVTVAEVHDLFFNTENPSYQQLHNDLTRIMDGNPNSAKLLIGLLGGKLRQTVQNTPDFRLNNFDDWMTKEIADLIDFPDQRTEKGSDLVFESDMMIATFDAEKGYVGCAMVNGETMTERVNQKYGQDTLLNMSTIGKLKTILGWKMNPRGIGLDTREGGYVDPQQRAVPPLKLLKKSDFKNMKQYTSTICAEER